MVSDSESNFQRQYIFEQNKTRLAQLAYRAIRRGMRPENFMVVCIDVDDPTWTPLVDHLMPGQDWDAIRARGERPIARGSVSRDLADLLSERTPGVRNALAGPPPTGHVHVAVLGANGASIYVVVPEPDSN